MASSNSLLVFSASVPTYFMTIGAALPTATPTGTPTVTRTPVAPRPWGTPSKLPPSRSTKRIPVVALTGHALAGQSKLARDAGCDGYLSKPISPKKLVAEVERCLCKLVHSPT